MFAVEIMERIIHKVGREMYRFIHPNLWNKRLQINGIPRICGSKNLKLGLDVSINDNVFIQASGGVKLGDRVTLSRGVTILTAGLDTENYCENASKRYREHVVKMIEIGSGTWIAANVTICQGVVIAENSIVAAGSVVTKSLLEPCTLYGGVPAKAIRKL